jgi:hypothetical protein
MLIQCNTKLAGQNQLYGGDKGWDSKEITVLNEKLIHSMYQNVVANLYSIVKHSLTVLYVNFVYLTCTYKNFVQFLIGDVM